jgi:hypothetical protein
MLVGTHHYGSGLANANQAFKRAILCFRPDRSATSPALAFCVTSYRYSAGVACLADIYVVKIKRTYLFLN